MFQIPEAYGQSWLTGWGYRKSHVIDPAAGAGTNYQVRVNVWYGSGVDGGENVYLAGKCRADFGDIRFTDDDKVTLLDYWMETKVDFSYAVFWVEVADNLNTTAQIIYVYYGKADAATTSNVAATFIREIDGALPVKLALPLDEGSGTVAYDKSGMGNDGTIHGASWVDGKYGKALSFDDVDVVIVPDAASLDITTQVTVSAWIKPLAENGIRCILDKGLPTYGDVDGEFNIFLINNHLTGAVCTDAGIQRVGDGAVIPTDVWSFVAMTFDGVTVRVYFNGVSTGTPRTVIGTMHANTRPVTIGKREIYYPFTGIIDEVRVYSRALTQDEIIDMYNNYPFESLNYAGRTLIRKYVSPEPLHGAWGSEETQTAITIDDITGLAALALVIAFTALAISAVAWTEKRKT